MGKKKITLSNVKSFIEGNITHYLDRAGLVPQYIVEQYHYRLEVCKDDCVKSGSCIYCGCPPIGKSWVHKSCNDGERFPDLMDKPSWEEYKEIMGINIEKILKDHGVE